MIDWTKVNPNILFLVTVGLVLLTVGGGIYLLATGNKDGAAYLMTVMVPLLLGMLGIKQTQAAQLSKQASDKAEVGVQQNETIIAKVDKVKQLVNGHPPEEKQA